MPAMDVTAAEIDRRVQGCRSAQATLLAALSGLSDEQARQPCLLPGWTVGHLLTHIARNGDSLVRRFEGAIRGEVVDQYVGGPARRQAEIDAGAGRGAADLVDDIRQTNASVDETC